MWAWAVSAEGQAVATWLANVFSLLAIMIGVAVALVEQRRSLADRLRETAREREILESQQAQRLHDLKQIYSEVLQLLDRAQNVLTLDLPKSGTMYMPWQPDQGKPFELQAIRSSLKAISLSRSLDVPLLVDVSRATTILSNTITPVGLDRAPATHRVLTLLKQQSDAFRPVYDRVKRRLEHL